MNNAIQSWVGFNLVKGIGPTRLQALLRYFGDITSAWESRAADLEAAGLNSRLAAAVEQMRNSEQLEQTLQRIERLGIQVLTWEDDLYPRRLKEIDQAPPVLYCLGELSADDQWAIAIVGTRRATSYGRQVAGELASELASFGLTIVSGLARGIDAISHQAALDQGGRSLAVLGSGVDVIYPPEHRRLAERIRQHGALLSDYPPGAQPEAGNFPARNRIISGLSLGVIVVEAGEKSGSLITAAYANEQNRRLFAVPGNIHAPQSKGTNLLIQEGAYLLRSAQEVLAIFNLAQVSEYRAARLVLPADATEARLFQVLSQQPLHIDEIRAQSGLPIEQVSASLALMELKGMARQVGSMHYIALREAPADYSAEANDQVLEQQTNP